MQEELEKQILDKSYSLKKNLVKNTFFNLLTSVIGRIGGLVFTILIARLLQPELFGVYSLATSVMLILLTFADLGINATAVRYLSSALVKNNKKAASYFRYLFKLKFILTTVFSLILLIIAYPLSYWIFNQQQLFYPLLLCSIYMFFLSFIGFYEAGFYSLQKVNYLSLKETIWQISRIILAVLGAYLIADKVLGVLGGIIISLIIALSFLLFLYKKHYPFLFQKTEEIEKKEKKRILNFMFFLTIGSITGAFFAYIDIVMLGFFVKPEFIGYYKAAFTIVVSVASLITITNVLLPVFTQLKGQRLEHIFNKVFKYSALLSFPAAFGLALIAQPFINVIYGESYLPASIILYLVSFLIIEFSTGSMFSWLFVAKEKPQIPVKILIIATLMNILLNYVLITSLINIGEIYAVLGAGVATVISRYFNFFALVRAARKKLNIKLMKGSIVKPLIASIIMAIALIIFKDLTKLIWPKSIIEIVFAAAVYFIVLFMIKGIEKKDFELISLLKK